MTISYARNRLELLARLGYAARGVVNLLIGLLALLAAFGRGGEVTGSKGALEALFSQAWGSVLLAVVALGLFGFALWRLLQSLLDADRRGRSWSALGARAGQFVSAIVYASLGVFALSLLAGSGAAGGEEQAARDWTRWLLRQPFGRWLTAGVALAVLGAAIGMAHKVWTASFRKHLACGPAVARWVIPLGRIGYAARSLVFLIIAAFLLLAAWQSDAREARGLGGALLAVQDQHFGPVVFGLVALGLAAFGAFEFAEARYRHIAAPTEAEIARTALRR
ncbi:DUF1206 domain-containing protein [Roseomonas indoligenes]|uniref:DUF1206 domain-containing protein n=1 Tax=Roseomonas indoligenes TaxID=2820811 RepID=A0A940MVR1_9PROT|nr:DUF1206 domain-containing protein [Pararoseomonas indoligenes]MBP0491664.1 DUF1206 domain-containing protein [Pararoseomonas indoligenes]